MPEENKLKQKYKLSTMAILITTIIATVVMLYSADTNRQPVLMYASYAIALGGLLFVVSFMQDSQHLGYTIFATATLLPFAASSSFHSFDAGIIFHFTKFFGLPIATYATACLMVNKIKRKVNIPLFLLFLILYTYLAFHVSSAVLYN